MPAGYSGTPLVKKLGIKDGYKIKLINPPKNYFDLLEELPPDVKQIKGTGKEINFIHLFVKNRKELDKNLLKCKEQLSKSGMIWVSWYKKASKIETDIDENYVRETGLDTGLVDVKICAVDDIWSGLKFVYRVKDR